MNELQQAILKNDTTLLGNLLERGLDPYKQDETGLTHLMSAAMVGGTNTIK